MLQWISESKNHSVKAEKDYRSDVDDNADSACYEYRPGAFRDGAELKVVQEAQLRNGAGLLALFDIKNGADMNGEERSK